MHKALKKLLFLLLLLPSLAFALTAEERLPDKQQEERARAIFKEIRCMVCSGESINDSNADLARDLRVLIRDKIKSGGSNEQIISYITERYGKEVLMTPPIGENTVLLWFGPVIMLLFGTIAIVLFFRKKPQNML